MKGSPALRVLPLVLVAGLGLAGCGGDSTDPSGGLGDLDPQAIQQSLNQTLDLFDAAAPANEFVAVALDELAAFGVEYAPSGSLIAVRDFASGSGLRRLPVLEPRVAFPAEVQGKTFVYDGGLDQWEVDPDATGAPATGIRVTWYATDGSGFPIAGQELGYIDLTDADAGGLSTLGVHVVSTQGGPEVTLADYSVGYAQTDDGTAWSEEFQAGGTLGDGLETVQFDISGSGSGNRDTGAEHYLFSVGYDGPYGAYDFDLEDTVAITGDTQETVTATTVVDGATTVLDLDFEETASVITGIGTLRHAGVLVANISSDGDAMDFQRPGGGSFSGADTTALRYLVADMVATGFYIPFSLPLLYM